MDQTRPNKAIKKSKIIKSITAAEAYKISESDSCLQYIWRYILDSANYGNTQTSVSSLMPHHIDLFENLGFKVIQRPINGGGYVISWKPDENEEEAIEYLEGRIKVLTERLNEIKSKKLLEDLAGI